MAGCPVRFDIGGVDSYRFLGMRLMLGAMHLWNVMNAPMANAMGAPMDLVDEGCPPVDICPLFRRVALRPRIPNLCCRRQRRNDVKLASFGYGRVLGR